MSGRESTAVSPTASPMPVDVIPATWWRLFSWNLVVWMLFLAPLLMLQQVDALRIYRTPGEIWRDLALLLPLAAVPAALLSTAGRVVRSLVRRLRGDTTGDSWAWAAVVVPTACICMWQVARAFSFIIKPASEFHLSVGPNMRAAAAIGILLLILLLLTKVGLAKLLRNVLPPALSLMPVALFVLIASVAICLISSRPVLRKLAPQPSAKAPLKPDVFLITLDSLASVDAAVCGKGPTLMPRLRKFADTATCFSRHYASSNFTTPSTSTLETGTLPWTHWAGQIGAQIAPEFQDRTMAMSLHELGYRTHSINANLLASPRHHGTYRAFNTETISYSKSLLTRFETTLSTLADSSIPLLLGPLLPGELDFMILREGTPVDPEWTYREVPPILKSSAPGQPLFVWVHTLPPHAPYLPPKSTKYRLLPPGELENYRQFRTGNTPYAPGEQGWIDKHRLRYQETVMGADEALGDFLDSLERAGRLDAAMVIISADHGESFEKGLIGHAGPLLHESLIRIPLVIKLPRQQIGHVVDAPVSQGDIAPTVLDAVGAAPLPRIDGRSLLPALRGEAMSDAPVFSMSMERQSRFLPLSQGHFAVMSGQFKLVRHLPRGNDELFDLASDPEERVDLASTRPDVAAPLKAILQARMTAAESNRHRMFGK